MADVLLLHSALGLRPAVLRAADRLRGQGHVVVTPDLYEGQLFHEVDAGVGHMRAVGWEELTRRAEAAAAGLSKDLALIGLSMGAGLVNHLMGTRGGRAAVMLYSGDPPERPWPRRVPVQVHHAIDDSWADLDASAALVRAVARAGGEASLYLYPGSRHLLDDDGMPDHFDPPAAELVWTRVEDFLRRRT